LAAGGLADELLGEFEKRRGNSWYAATRQNSLTGMASATACQLLLPIVKDQTEANAPCRYDTVRMFKDHSANWPLEKQRLGQDRERNRSAPLNVAAIEASEADGVRAACSEFKCRQGKGESDAWPADHS